MEERLFSRAGWRLTVIPVLLLALFLYGRYDPQLFSFFPKCPFYLLTGWQCPGCGSQRCLHQLLQGNLAEAFRLNALLLPSIPYILFGLLMENAGLRNRFPQLWKVLYSRKAIWVVLAILLAFAVIRNL